MLEGDLFYGGIAVVIRKSVTTRLVTCDSGTSSLLVSLVSDP